MKCTLIAFLFVNFCTRFTNELPLEAPNINTIVQQNRNSNNDGRRVPHTSIDPRHPRVLKSQMRILGHYLVKTQKLHPDGRKGLNIDFACVGCIMAVGMLQFFIELGLSDSAITSQMRNVCSLLKVSDDEVCAGAIKLFGPEVMYLLRNVDVSPDEACGFIMEGTCPDKYTPRHEWNIDIPPEILPKPLSKPFPNDNAPRLKVLHLSDNHYDPYYAEGTNANCEHPLCCRTINGYPSHPDDKAGKWGTYGKCDTPKRTIDHLLEHIARDHPDIDYILWTGDLPPHDVWNQSRSSNLEIIKETTKQLTDKFPNIPIFPALGNHESAPVDTFPPHYLDPEKISSSWLYDELDSIWKKWLPTNVSETVRRGAFYSILLKPDLRIISLNMNYCNNKNFWLLVNTRDPDDELKWLIEELAKAEKKNEKVHIIGHIAPGSEDCLKVWSRNFYKIVTRFQHTIMAQFYGHTHYDEIEIFYDADNLQLAKAEKKNEKVHIIGHIAPGSEDCLKVWSRNFYKIITRFEHTIMAQFYGHTHYDEIEIFYDADNLQLAKAEKKNEKVHIIGHIAPGSEDCLKVWSRNFYKIITRFEHTIMAQFYGHTHYDEIEIFYDADNLQRPTSIAYIGPSVTPFINLNPGYRIYYVDGDHAQSTRMVVDHETWVMDLGKANIDDNPVWYELYSAKSAYNMSGLSPKDWHDLINSMDRNHELFDLYYRFYWKDSPKRPKCDTNCKSYLLCDAKCGRSHDRKALCTKGRKWNTHKQRNTWTNGVHVELNSAMNLLNFFKQRVQIATNDVDPLNIYDEL